MEARRVAQGMDRGVDLGAQRTAAAPDGLRVRILPFALALCWRARTMVESIMAYSLSASLRHPPQDTQTNGMVERFNCRIADVLKPHRFNSVEDVEQSLMRYVALYNDPLP